MWSRRWWAVTRWMIAIQAVVIIGVMAYNRYTSSVLTTSSDSKAGQPSSMTPPKRTEAFGVLAETFDLSDDDVRHFRARSSATHCFIRGTDWTTTTDTSECQCLAGYYGPDCGIPESVWRSCPAQCATFRVRDTPRRLIHGLNMNHELEFLEMRLAEVGDVVDVFIVGESNVTAGGDPSPLYLLPQLRNGFAREYQSKILHVFIDHFPPEGLIDGWFADTFIRDYMGEKGLARVRGVRDDDLFLLLDADEIPNREVLEFLKLYDGYPEPISLTLRWSVFGYFWKRSVSKTITREDVTSVVAVSTMHMIRQVYEGKVMSMRRNKVPKSKLDDYAMTVNHPVAQWNIGRIGSYAGFHCSWCYRPEGIRLKLQSAQKDDKPRWGDYPEKLDLDYIAGLIREGRWFDGTKPFFLVRPETDGGEALFAPSFVWKNAERFSYLLQPP